MTTAENLQQREQTLRAYVQKVKEHRDWGLKGKNLREQNKALAKEFDKSEDDLKALQSVGQIVGEVLKYLGEDKFIVKASSGR